jgi:hypothetical protein
MAVAGSGADRDDPPDGMGAVDVEVTRSDTQVTVVVGGDPASATVVSVCPGLLPGPSDAAGMLERIRVSGCVPANPDPSAGEDAWTLSFASLDAEQTVDFDAAERWLVAVVDVEAAPDDEGRVAGAWIEGGPLLPSGPLLP